MALQEQPSRWKLKPREKRMLIYLLVETLDQFLLIHRYLWHEPEKGSKLLNTRRSG